jgi:hypothetical protein
LLNWVPMTTATASSTRFPRMMKFLKPLMPTGFPSGAKYSCGHTGNKCHGGTGANAVPHARSRFTVTVSRSAGCVRISVRDEVPLEEGCPLAGGRGHGRDLVAQLSVRQLPGGKVVWGNCRPVACSVR